MQRPYRLRIRPIQHVPAVPSYLHKFHLQKHPQVLRHRRLLKSQSHHNFPDRPFPSRQKLQYLPTPRFRHRIKRIRCGRRPRHATTLHSHMGICQPFFGVPRPFLLGLLAFRALLPQRPNSVVIPSGADRLFPPTSLLRSSRSAQSRNFSSMCPSQHSRSPTPSPSSSLKNESAPAQH
jgi:hypothetical protein